MSALDQLKWNSGNDDFTVVLMEYLIYRNKDVNLVFNWKSIKDFCEKQVITRAPIWKRIEGIVFINMKICKILEYPNSGTVRITLATIRTAIRELNSYNRQVYSTYLLLSFIPDQMSLRQLYWDSTTTGNLALRIVHGLEMLCWDVVWIFHWNSIRLYCDTLSLDHIPEKRKHKVHEQIVFKIYEILEFPVRGRVRITLPVIKKAVHEICRKYRYYSLYI
jgi:hypothetical protein